MGQPEAQVCLGVPGICISGKLAATTSESDMVRKLQRLRSDKLSSFHEGLL